MLHITRQLYGFPGRWINSNAGCSSSCNRYWRIPITISHANGQTFVCLYNDITAILSSFSGYRCNSSDPNTAFTGYNDTYISGCRYFAAEPYSTILSRGIYRIAKQADISLRTRFENSFCRT